MLQKLKSQSNKWFIKILLGVIIVSFGVWGIGQTIHECFSNRPLARVGGKPISVPTFMRALDNKTKQIEHQLDRSLTAAEQESMHIKQLVLDELVEQTVLDLAVEDLNLVASPDYVKKQVRDMEVFHRQGVFSQQSFEQILNTQNIVPKNFMDNVANETMVQQLSVIVQSNLHLPKSYQSFLLRSLEQNKVLMAANIEFNKIKVSNTVSDKVLKIFFDEKKTQYTLPETRTISVLFLYQDQLLDGIKVSQEDLVKNYKDRNDKGEFTSPAQRHVVMIGCVDISQAHKVLQEIEKGKSMEEVVKVYKKSTFKDLGWLEIDNAPSGLGQMLFGLKIKNKETSGILSADDGFVIYQVVEEKEEQRKKFEDIQHQLEKEFKQEKNTQYIEKIKATIDDELAAGKTIQDIAKTHGLRCEILEKISNNGVDFKNQDILQEYDDKVKKIITDHGFRLDVGTDSGFQEAGDSISVLVQVNDVHPPMQPLFDHVKKRVTDDYLRNEQQEKASAIAQDLMKSASAEDLEKLAKTNQAIQIKEIILSRAQFHDKKKNSIQIQAGDLSQIFSQKINKPYLAHTKKGLAVVMVLRDIAYKPSLQSKKQMEKITKQGLVTDFWKAVVDALKKRYPIDMNNDLWSLIKTQ